VLEDGRRNVVPTEVPRVWAEIMLEQAEQAPGLFLGLLPYMAGEAAPELQAELTEAGQAAVQAIQAYAEWVQNEVLPQAAGDFAVGRELFDEMLREDHMVDYNADQLLETGWQQFHATRAQMEAVAQEIDPNKPVKELLEAAKADHPTAEGLLDAYRQQMAAIRQYVIDQGIASIPPDETLRIVETPAYLRPIIPYAAYMSPGLLEERQEGIFIVTPVDPDAPPDEQEQKLRGHYWAKLPITALWRAGRIILDVSLHTRGMSVNEAVQFLVQECSLEPTNALAEVRRYTQSPTQPQSYLMGKLAILELVADYRRAHPDASLRQVHDALLGSGSLPPRLMRQRLL
jgi:uncharacterized protein (DUF885 family)